MVSGAYIIYIRRIGVSRELLPHSKRSSFSRRSHNNYLYIYIHTLVCYIVRVCLYYTSYYYIYMRMHVRASCRHTFVHNFAELICIITPFRIYAQLYLLLTYTQSRDVYLFFIFIFIFMYAYSIHMHVCLCVCACCSVYMPLCNIHELLMIS